MAKLRRLIASVLIVSTAAMGFPGFVQAGTIPTHAALSEAKKQAIETLLAREEVRAELEAHGVRALDVQLRVAAMTDEEVNELQSQIDNLPAGAADPLGVLLTLFVVLLITDILGFTKVFPFTRSIRR
jgi:hypothetical protein